MALPLLIKRSEGFIKLVPLYGKVRYKALLGQKSDYIHYIFHKHSQVRSISSVGLERMFTSIRLVRLPNIDYELGGANNAKAEGSTPSLTNFFWKSFIPFVSK
jgi:hypothetical protein